MTKINITGKKNSIKKDDWEKIEKNNRAIALNVLYAKKEKKYILLMFQNITQIIKKQLILLMIPNGKRMTLFCCKKTITIIKRNNV